MAGPNYVLDKGYAVGGAVRQFRFVTLGGSEVVSEAAAAGAQSLGVCQEEVSADDATRGRIVDVRLLGISRCIAGAAITIGAPVRVDNQGRVTALAATTANQNQVGIALQAATAAGDHVDVFLTPGVSRST
jgi:hypothetical protein